jgi:hypothetical protein
MQLTDDLKAGLGVAFNEATLLGVEVQPLRRLAGVTLGLLTLPPGEGPAPEDPRVQLRLSPVGRVAVSLRLGRWDDPAAQVVPVTLADLLPTVRSFGGLPIYGWEFLDVYPGGSPPWADRLSLDWRQGDDGLSHTLSLFQEGPDRHLDLCIWFDALRIYDPVGRELGLDEVVAGGRRWWDAFHAGDPRTAGHGMYPLRGDQ